MRFYRCEACIIPFPGGSLRHPLTCAMVNASPVIATRAVDIPEDLGELAIYIDRSAAAIAEAICEMESGRKNLTAWGEPLRTKALAELDYNRVAEELSAQYSRISGKEQLLRIQPSAVA